MSVDVRRAFEGRTPRLAVGAVVVVALLLIPPTTTTSIEGLVFEAMVYAMLAISWNIIAGYAGQVSLGHAAFFGFGAYVSAWLTTPTAAGLPENIAVPAVVAVLVGGLATALLSGLLGPVIFRLRGHYFSIGTLALAAIIQLLLNNARSVSGGATGYYVQNSLGSVGVYYLAVVALVVVFGVSYWMRNNRLGLAMRAINDDQDAANSLGVWPLRYKMWAFVLSALFAGVAGGLYGQYTLYLNASSTLDVSWMIDTLAIVILGGIGTVLGPLFGTVLFMVLDNVFQSFAAGLATAIEGALLVVFIVFIPGGLYEYIK